MYRVLARLSPYPLSPPPPPPLSPSSAPCPFYLSSSSAVIQRSRFAMESPLILCLSDGWQAAPRQQQHQHSPLGWHCRLPSTPASQLAGGPDWGQTVGVGHLHCDGSNLLLREISFSFSFSPPSLFLSAAGRLITSQTEHTRRPDRRCCRTPSICPV